MNPTYPTNLTADQLRVASCRWLPPDWWFPDRDIGQSNHGNLAKRQCAACPTREPCLTAAVARSEMFGIWGAAGEGRRRVLRRAFTAGPEVFEAAVAAHWRQVDGTPAPGDDQLLSPKANGGHGRRSTYGRGCRCGACELATSFDGVVASLPVRRPRRPRGVAA